MSVAIEEAELADVIAAMSLVAELFRVEAPAIWGALERFVGTYDDDRCSQVRAVADELLCYADFLAQAMGFPDADMDPGKARPRARRFSS